MKGHEHKYISRTIGDECEFCGLLKSTIESIDKTSDQVWNESLTPRIDELPEVKDGFPERLEEMIVNKINELVQKVIIKII